MGSSLTIINQEQQKKLYKNLEGKWVIELDSEKIKNINDFCIAIMDEIDIIYDYKHLYGYDWYSFKDAAMESEHIVKKLFGDKEANVVIIYDNSKLIMSEIDRGISYQYLIALMQWWSNKLNLEIYLVFDNMTKIFNSKIIRDDMSNEDKIFKLEENKNIFIMDLKQNELADEFIKRIDKNINFSNKKEYVLIFNNSYNFVQGIDYQEAELMANKLIEDILLKKNKKIKIYLLF